MSVENIQFAAILMRSYISVPVVVGKAFSHVGDEASATKAFLRAVHTMNRVIDIGPDDDPMLGMLAFSGFFDLAAWLEDVEASLQSRITSIGVARDYLEIAAWVAAKADIICRELPGSMLLDRMLALETLSKHILELLRSEAESS